MALRFRIKIDIPDFDKFDSHEDKIPNVFEYDSELIIDFDRQNHVSFRIFFQPKEYLWQKIHNYINSVPNSQLMDKVSEFLNKIIFSTPLDYSNLTNVDFKKYIGNNIRVKTSESNNYVEFITTGVDLVFAVSEPNDSVFYLNRAAFDLIELNFKYTKHLGSQNKNYIWEPIPKIVDFLTFYKVLYKPDFDIYNSSSNEEKITITKEPIIKFLNSGLSYSEIKKHIKAICALFSFYSGKDITYYNSKIYVGHSEFNEIKTIPNSYSDYSHGMFIWEIRNPINLLASVKAEFVVENIDFIANCIQQFNQALQMQSESKFMLLYSVIEQIRNFCIEKKIINQETTVKDKYQFIHNEKVNHLIKQCLENVSEFVTPEMKEIFISDIPNKIKEIKRLTMKNQFNSFFTYLNINPEDYQLDFKTLLELRNEIFHGNPVKDYEKLEKVNAFNCLPKFTGMVILKFLGVNNLKEIVRVDRSNYN